ncbi:MAG: PAS domain S-box protein, partial [Nitrospinae bacterium]|nr:PAS domain S-box protein [Nitrospinota bacterium]
MALHRFTFLHTLQARILLALALIGVVPLAVVGLSVATLDRRVLAEQSAREITGLALGLSGQVDIYVANMLNDSRVIAALPEIVSMDPVRQDALLKELFHHYPEFSRLSTFNPSGELLASSHTDRLPSVAQRESFQTAIRRGHQAWEVATGLTSGRWRFLINTPIRDVDRRVVGVLGTMIDLVNLSAVMERVQAAGRRVFVLDAGGRVLLHPDQAAVQERRDYSWLGVPTGGRLANAGTVRYPLEGEMYIAGYAPVLEMGWTVVVERSEREALAPAAQSWYIALAGLQASGFLALLTAVFLARTLARPVRELAAAARALAAGHPAVPLPAIASDKGELGMLIEAFAGMREAVISREEEVTAEARFLRAQTEVANVALSSLQAETLIPRLLEAIARAQGYSYGNFWRVLPEGKEAVIVATFGEITAPFLGSRRDVNDPVSVVAKTIRTGQPIFQNHTDKREFNPAHLTWALGTRALLGLPIISRTGEVVACMAFADVDNPERFKDRDVVQGMVLATQVSQALENSELFGQIQRLEEQHRVLTDSLDDSVFMLDTQGRFTFANIAAQRLIGSTPGEFIGRSFTEILAPEEQARVFDRFQRAIAGEPMPSHLEVEVVRKDGRRVPMEASMSNLVVNGQIVGRVGVARDITERKRAATEAERRKREAEIIADLARILNTSLDVDTVLQRLLEGAREICESERALIALREPGSDVMFFRYQVGSRYPDYKTLPVVAGKGAGGQVLLTG